MNTLQAKLKATLGKPQVNYFVLLSVTFILTALGLTMVLSSSMVTSYAQGSNVFGEFIKQAVVVVLGLIGMWIAMRMRPSTVQRYSGLLLGIAFVLLVMVLIPGIGIGGEEVGSNSWIRVGPIGVQPSEVAKLALAVWGSVQISSRLRLTQQFNQALGPFLVVCIMILVLILAQKDLGMMFTVGIVVLSLLFFAGVSSKLIALFLGLIAALGTMTIARANFRSARITTWLDALTLHFPETSTQGSAYQSHQGILSLSDGGLTGAGLGQSRAKWFYLPEAKNDFIFAIVGEELGLIGAVAVVLLFALLGIFGIRTALAQADPFLKMLAATLTVGIVVQAFYNMGYVVGYFPVTGVQLPLISAGGSSAIITLISLGLLCSCARHEPEAISSMQHEGRPLFDRLFFLPEPLPYVPGDARRQERRTTTQTYGEPVTRPRVSQDVQRERRRVDASMDRMGSRAPRRGYDGLRRQQLPPRGATRRQHEDRNNRRR